MAKQTPEQRLNAITHIYAYHKEQTPGTMPWLRTATKCLDVLMNDLIDRLEKEAANVDKANK